MSAHIYEHTASQCHHEGVDLGDKTVEKQTCGGCGTVFVRDHEWTGKTNAWGTTAPTKQREGDQVLPSGDESVMDDQQWLIDKITERRQVGVERYGQGHRPLNGRNTFLDFFEEHLDGLVYLASILRATEADRDQLVEEITKAIEAHDLQRDVLKDTSMLWNRQDAEHQAKYVVARIYGWLAGQRMSE